MTDPIRRSTGIVTRTYEAAGTKRSAVNKSKRYKYDSEGMRWGPNSRVGGQVLASGTSPFVFQGFILRLYPLRPTARFLPGVAQVIHCDSSWRSFQVVCFSCFEMVWRTLIRGALLFDSPRRWYRWVCFSLVGFLGTVAGIVGCAVLSLWDWAVTGFFGATVVRLVCVLGMQGNCFLLFWVWGGGWGGGGQTRFDDR